VSRAITGTPGTGSLLVYTLAPTESFRLDTVAFTLTADSSGNGHFPEVILGSLGGFQIARIPDWNAVPDAAVVDYTFGVGLTPFCGIANTGGAVQNDLPDTALDDSCTILIRSLDAAGAVVTGDQLSAITLWVSDLTTAGAVPTLPLLVPVPLGEQAA
jgi:hypothetical protein